MKAKLVKEYRSKREDTKGKPMWQYLVTGTPDERARFKKQQKEYYLEDKVTKDILWNRDKDHGRNPEIVETMDKEFRMLLDHEDVAYEKAEKRPLFAKMYFDKAQEQIVQDSLPADERKGAKKKAVASTETVDDTAITQE